MGKNSRPNAMMLFIRVVVGGYLINIGWDLARGAKGNASEFSVIFFIAGIVFIGFGITTILFSLRDLIKGRYQGGPGDVSEENSKKASDNFHKEND